MLIGQRSAWCFLEDAVEAGEFKTEAAVDLSVTTGTPKMLGSITDRLRVLPTASASSESCRILGAYNHRLYQRLVFLGLQCSRTGERREEMLVEP